MESSLTSSIYNHVLCCYVNATAHTEITRITNIPGWYFERVVFPGQRLIFKAPVSAKLEIHTNIAISSILSETIYCQKLQLTSFVSDYSTALTNGQRLLRRFTAE